MESALVGLVLDSSVLITAERRKLRPDQAIESVQKTVGEIPVVLCSPTVAEIGTGSIAPTRRKSASGGVLSWMNSKLRSIHPVTESYGGDHCQARR